MPTLAPAPSLNPAASAVELTLPSGSFLGRSLAEYTQFFALHPVALKGRDVLDVAAGPSSFTAEACARRIDAVAVDPLYGEPVATLAAHVERDCEAMSAQMRAQRRLFKVGGGGGLPRPNQGTPPGNRCTFPSFAMTEADRRGAAQRFLADYETHFAYGRYVGAALPRLPFFDGTFDLVLCAHLLFTDAMRFDFEWHLAACRELVRVSADEARIHPLCGGDGRPYASLPRLRRELRAGGVASQIVEVDYEFFAGANSMLVLRRAAP